MPYFSVVERTTNLREGNVFSRVGLSVGLPSGHYARCIGPHCTAHPFPDMERHSTRTPGLLPSMILAPLDMGPQSIGTVLLVTSGGHHWRPVQNCLFQDPTPAPILTSGVYC